MEKFFGVPNLTLICTAPPVPCNDGTYKIVALFKSPNGEYYIRRLWLYSPDKIVEMARKGTASSDDICPRKEWENISKEEALEWLENTIRGNDI